MSWSTLTVDPDSATGLYPSPRHGHAFVYDVAEYGAPSGIPHPDLEYRALLWGGKEATGLADASVLWVLWIPETGSSENYRWQRVEVPGTTPSARFRFAAEMEQSLNFVVSGGDVGGSASAETWRLPQRYRNRALTPVLTA
jgi:hypothetical protein